MAGSISIDCIVNEASGRYDASSWLSTRWPRDASYRNWGAVEALLRAGGAPAPSQAVIGRRHGYRERCPPCNSLFEVCHGT